MKKNLLLVLAVLICTNVFAGPLGDLANALSSGSDSSATPVEGTLSEEKDVFPILWKWTHSEIALQDGVLGASIEMKSFDVMAKTYSINQKVYFKYGFGLQCQEGDYIIKQEGTKITVTTTSLVTYAVDKNFKRKTDPIKNQPKTLVEYSKSILDSLVKDASEIDATEYNEWFDKCYTDLIVQQSAGVAAGNKLKAKKWYEAHPIIGKTIETQATMSQLSESKKTDYAYQMNVLLINIDKNYVETNISITVYSNDDAVLDYKQGQTVKIKGKITDVKYTGDYAQYYVINSLTIEE